MKPREAKAASAIIMLKNMLTIDDKRVVKWNMNRKATKKIKRRAKPVGKTAVL
jgi:hypothetical protein